MSSDDGAVEAMAALYRAPTTVGLVGSCQRLAASVSLEVAVVSAIVVNTLVLMTQNPANSFAEQTTLGLTILDMFLSVLFTVVRCCYALPSRGSGTDPAAQEMVVKIIAMGLIGHRGYLDVSLPLLMPFASVLSTYPLSGCQDAWNKLDFVVVFSSWVNIAVELFDFDLGIEVRRRHLGNLSHFC